MKKLPNDTDPTETRSSLPAQSDAPPPVSADLRAALSSAERASFEADVRRIMSMLKEPASPADKISAFLGLKNSSLGSDAGPAATRAAAASAGPIVGKRSSSAAPAALPSTKSWAMRRFS